MCCMISLCNEGECSDLWCFFCVQVYRRISVCIQCLRCIHAYLCASAPPSLHPNNSPHSSSELTHPQTYLYIHKCIHPCIHTYKHVQIHEYVPIRICVTHITNIIKLNMMTIRGNAPPPEPVSIPTCIPGLDVSVLLCVCMCACLCICVRISVSKMRWKHVCGDRRNLPFILSSASRMNDTWNMRAIA